MGFVMRTLLALVGLAALVLGVFVYTRSDGLDSELSAPELNRPALAGPDGDGAELLEPRLAAEDDVPARTEATTEAAAETEALAAAAAPDARFHGRLVDALGRPVPDAVVTLTRAPQRFAFGPPAEVDALATAKSDSRGEFELAVRELEAGAAARVRVRARDLARLDREVRVPAEPVADLGELVLDFGAILGGRVVDEDGAPVAGAAVRVEESGGSEFVAIGMALGRRLVETDAAGRFEIVDQPVGPWTFQVTHPDHPDLWVDGETASADDHRADLLFTLRDGARIEGRIVGAPAGELASVELLAWPVAETSGWSSADGRISARSMPRPRPAEVAPDGRFAVGGLEFDAAYSLQGRRPLEGRFWNEPVTDPVVVPSGELAAELAWSEGAAVEFRVVDASTGAPLERLGVRSGLGYLMRLTDERGAPRDRFPEGLVRLDGLRPSAEQKTFQVELLAPGYAAWSRTDIELVVGETIDLGTIALKPVPRVEVVVLDDETDDPVSGARVDLRKELEASGGRRIGVRLGGPSDAPPPPGEPSTHRDRTDASGRATVSSFPGEEARVHVRADGYAPLASDVLELPEGDTRVTLRLVAGATALVTVLDRAGEPAPGHVVEHSRPDGSAGLEFEPGEERRSDASGRVRFPYLEPGRHWFRVAEDANEQGFVMRMQGGDGSPPGEGWVALDLAGGDEVPLELVLAPRSVLAGVVTERGTPLAGAELRLAKEDSLSFLMGSAPTTKTSSTGAYRFEDVKAGEYELTVSHRTRALPTTLDVDLDEGENERDVDLAINRVTGRVTDPAGEPVAGARVRAQRATSGGQGTQIRMVMVTSNVSGSPSVTLSNGGDDEGLVATTDEDGRYELRGLPIRAEIEVDVRADDHEPGTSEPFELDEGEDRDGVDVVIVPGGSLRVQVDLSDLPGMYMINARFLGESEGPVEGRSTTLSPKGEATLGELAVGPWEISLRPLGPAEESAPDLPEPKTVEVVVGEEVLVEF